MFTDISWTAYLLTIGTATLLWYFILGFTQYYKGVKNFLDSKRTTSFSTLYGTTESYSQADTIPKDALTPKGEFDQPALQDFDTIEELVERVKSCVADAVEKHIPKEGFIELLGKLLRDYPTLKTSKFRPSVSEFIAGESQEQGFDGITVEEIESLWKL